jgi:hypothetical protein
MKEMFTRTQFAVDQGGYFPEIKVKEISILFGLAALKTFLIRMLPLF